MQKAPEPPTGLWCEMCRFDIQRTEAVSGIVKLESHSFALSNCYWIESNSNRNYFIVCFIEQSKSNLITFLES